MQSALLPAESSPLISSFWCSLATDLRWQSSLSPPTPVNAKTDNQKCCSAFNNKLLTQNNDYKVRVNASESDEWANNARPGERRKFEPEPPRWMRRWRVCQVILYTHTHSAPFCQQTYAGGPLSVVKPAKKVGFVCCFFHSSTLMQRV